MTLLKSGSDATAVTEASATRNAEQLEGPVAMTPGAPHCADSAATDFFEGERGATEASVRDEPELPRWLDASIFTDTAADTARRVGVFLYLYLRLR